MTNFDRFLPDPQFASFAPAAVAAEKILHIDLAACMLNCRRAMECGVKWMYSVDSALVKPFQDTLVNLMNTGEFRDIVGKDIWKRMDHIRRMGNAAAHSGKALTRAQAELCLENLYIFLDFVAYCYGSDYQEGQFDRSLLEERPAAPAPVSIPDVDLEALIAENQALKAELTARREEQKPTYVPKPLDLSEYDTRKLYIDAMLLDAGWTQGQDWLDEVELHGMPNKSGTGYADYVLYGSDGRPLAVVEAKRTCDDPARGRQQAKLYAGILEEQYGRRPVVFLTNGFDTRIDDGAYPERRVASIYSRRDLGKLFNLRAMRTSLTCVAVNKDVAGRWYQESAIKAVCDSFARSRRKALLVMATGSGKTRTVIALCDVLLRHGWVKNILFLADRNSLVTQAKRSFVNLLPSLSVTNLCEEKDNTAARCVFSTYQTMMNCIDSVKDEEGKLFTCGHFDLVICDEAHRSIYNKYRDIFNYFDAPLVGLTATPKDEIDKNTYEVFELENGMPTYGYELSQAVTDGFLVDFMTVETRLKFLEEGIAYDELSDEDKEAYERTFEDENGALPEKISSSALNEWVFNEGTIREVLHILMTNGLKIDYGEKQDHHFRQKPPPRGENPGDFRRGVPPSPGLCHGHRQPNRLRPGRHRPVLRAREAAPDRHFGGHAGHRHRCAPGAEPGIFQKGDEQGQVLADDRPGHPAVSRAAGRGGQGEILHFRLLRKFCVFPGERQGQACLQPAGPSGGDFQPEGTDRVQASGPVLPDRGAGRLPPGAGGGDGGQGSGAEPGKFCRPPAPAVCRKIQPRRELRRPPLRGHPAD